jgi:hypothetical protein
MRVMTDRYDYDKIDEMVVALLYLTLHDGVRVWKNVDFSAMDRLHVKGYISDPTMRGKSVVMTDEGLKRARELFDEHFLKR